MCVKTHRPLSQANMRYGHIKLSKAHALFDLSKQEFLCALRFIQDVPNTTRLKNQTSINTETSTYGGDKLILRRKQSSTAVNTLTRTTAEHRMPKAHIQCKEIPCIRQNRFSVRCVSKTNCGNTVPWRDWGGEIFSVYRNYTQFMNFSVSMKKFKINGSHYWVAFYRYIQQKGQECSVGIATRYTWTVRESNPRGAKIFRTRPNRSWGKPSQLYNGYRVFPGCKAARA